MVNIEDMKVQTK